MAAKNLLANQFATIYNSEIRNKKECIVVPASRLASDILRVLQKHKYVGEFEY
ncbi:MAG: 30S ribosomal protein S8, partial [Thaumarchaeota archaeon]|nr:30S ribosomal protein S8 [Nitrososphaerota archaeon]